MPNTLVSGEKPPRISDTHARYEVAPVRVPEYAVRANAECIECSGDQAVVRYCFLRLGKRDHCPLSGHSAVHDGVLQVVSPSIRHGIHDHEQLTRCSLIDFADRWLRK